MTSEMVKPHVKDPMNDDLDVRGYLLQLWQGRRWILGAALVSMLLAGVWRVISPRPYESSALVHLSKDSAPVYASTASAEHLLTSTLFLESVSREHTLGTPGWELKKAVRVQPLAGTQLLRIKARDKDPNRARQIATAVVQSFLARTQERVNERRARANEQIQRIRAQLDEVARLQQLTRRSLEQGNASAQGPMLDRGGTWFLTLNTMGVVERTYVDLQAAQHEAMAELSGLDSAVLVDEPRIPELPLPPGLTLTMVLAGLVGMIAGVGFVVVRGYLKTPSPALVPAPVVHPAHTPSTAERPLTHV